jgi:Leucine rich repeat
LNNVEPKKISCEKVEIDHWIPPVELVKTCKMLETTVIDDNNVNISRRDETVNGLRFDWNKKIAFLPVRLNDTFPNLIGYSVMACSIKEVSKKNFEGLRKLVLLRLSNNQIEKISGGTFEDLVSLRTLNLGKSDFDWFVQYFNFDYSFQQN